MADIPQDPPRPHGPLKPCSAAMGIIGVPARRWLTRAELYGQLKRSKALLDACPLEGVTLEACAREAGLSVHHFLRLFHEVEGVTPYQYLNARRIREAKRLLETTQLDVAQIAVEVGFGSASALGRRFKLETGVTPTAYRRSNSQFRSSMANPQA